MSYDGSVKVIEQCCAPVLAEPLGVSEAVELAAAFKVLADPTRLRILSLVANAAGGELCACELPELTGRSQPTVSHHLKMLWRTPVSLPGSNGESGRGSGWSRIVSMCCEKLSYRQETECESSLVASVL